MPKSLKAAKRPFPSFPFPFPGKDSFSVLSPSRGAFPGAGGHGAQTPRSSSGESPLVSVVGGWSEGDLDLEVLDLLEDLDRLEDFDRLEDLDRLEVLDDLEDEEDLKGAATTVIGGSHLAIRAPRIAITNP